MRMLLTPHRTPRTVATFEEQHQSGFRNDTSPVCYRYGPVRRTIGAYLSRIGTLQALQIMKKFWKLD